MPAVPELPKAKVSLRKDLTHDLMTLKLKTPTPFTFRPGQYITIGLQDVERPYSIVSSPAESEVELFVELVEDGPLTTKIWKLKEGDEVSYRPRAKGIFWFQPKYTTHILLATVTGVVPYISYFRWLEKQPGGFGENKIYLLYGGSFTNELAYSDELADFAKRYPKNIMFIPTVSRPNDPKNAGWKGQTGRVNGIVGDMMAKWGVTDKEKTLLYACGHPGMIEDVKERFMTKGWKVQEERFWKDDDTPVTRPVGGPAGHVEH